MDTSELCYLTVSGLAELIRAREVSPVEVTAAILDRIERVDPRLNSFIATWPEDAVDAAREAESEIAAGRYRGPFHGVPVAMKDIFATNGKVVTNGSRIYADAVATCDATVVARLRAAGVIFVGSLNLYQFACGTVMNPDFGPVRNAWDSERIAGGSSSGSGTAVAAGLCYASLGTDTGGSVRIPANLNGVVGLKPTHGRVSLHGLFPLSPALDHIGPITRDVRDTAMLMNVIAGPDAADPSAADEPVPDYTAALTGDIKGTRIGLPVPYFFKDLQPGVAATVTTAIQRLRDLGANIDEVEVAGMEATHEILWSEIAGDAGVVHAEHLALHAAVLDPDVRNVAERGADLLASEYIRAQQGRRATRRELLRALEPFDVLVTPTSPIVSPGLGEDTVEIGGRWVPMRPELRRFTLQFNLAGLPTITVPCGFDETGLPVGLQVVGRPFDEPTVLRVAHAFEQATGWHTRHPGLG